MKNSTRPDFKYWGDAYPVNFLVKHFGHDLEILQEEGAFPITELFIEAFGLEKQYWREGNYYFRKLSPNYEYYFFQGKWYRHEGKPLEAALGKFDYYSFPPQKEFDAMRHLGHKKLSTHQSRRLSYWKLELDSQKTRINARRSRMRLLGK